ncbi:MAG: EmrB/QacA subfamily drug resistance transporter [Gammaproteobacteria bacterium]|jgi:EmrB/QacA subfamily drug resistance transporter
MHPKHASLIIATIATGMIYLDQSAVNIILPAIQRDLSITISDLQWILNIFILLTTAPLLLCGVLGDRFGRVRILKIGMILFGCGSLACGLINSFEWLLVFRAIQGLGASMIAAVGLAILHYHSPVEERGRLIGTWATCTTIIISMGPTFAGAMVEWFHWQYVFLVNLPAVLVAIWIAQRWVPENSSDKPTMHISWISTLLLLVGMGSLLFALIEVSRKGSSVLLMTCLGTGGVTLLIGFLQRQRSRSNALIPSAVFEYSRFVAINLITLWQWLAIAGVFFVLPLHLQWTQGYSPLETGMAMLPITTMVALLSRSAGKIADRFGAFIPISSGIFCVGIAVGCLAWSRSLDHYWLGLFPILIIYGIGMAALIAPLTTVAMNSLPVTYSGIASGVNNSASRISTMVSIALIGSFMSLYFEPKWQGVVQSSGLALDLKNDLIAQAGMLGAITLSDIDNSTIRESLFLSKNELLTSSFSWVMAVAAAVSLLSLAVLILLNNRQTIDRHSFWDVSDKA